MCDNQLRQRESWDMCRHRCMHVFAHTCPSHVPSRIVSKVVLLDALTPFMSLTLDVSAKDGNVTSKTVLP